MYIHTWLHLPLLNDSTAGDLLPTIFSIALQNLVNPLCFADIPMSVSRISLFDSWEVGHEMILSTVASVTVVT